MKSRSLGKPDLEICWDSKIENDSSVLVRWLQAESEKYEPGVRFGFPAASPSAGTPYALFTEETTNNLREGMDIGAQVKNPFFTRSQQNAKPHEMTVFAVFVSRGYVFENELLLNLNN
ncbi:hypothetical protein JTE90_018813 [Oedothorax gibbosus]|uniref:Uncharacterized protein n=1 Tax=Oedothorax gibbosus TaxID=931172 RepID=A0AAV6TDU0_9ARAC|nr:hypothetical protein JTE90_018813 [Oedothorax gibbosus]